MNWIDVNENLPTEGKYVIALSANQKFHIARTYETGFGSKSKTKWMDACCDYDFDYFTHWMPLPDLPKDYSNSL